LQKILTNFFVTEVFIKNVIFSMLTLNVTHVFIKQIFKAVKLARPFPLPLIGRAGGGDISGSFQRQVVALVMATKQ
jgi:hypothetical protein